MIKKALTSKSIDKKFASLVDWQLNTKKTQISKTFTSATFITAFAFTAKIAVHAEVLNHHPDIELSYGKVKVILTTHDAGGLTENDFELAKRIDAVALRSAQNIK